MTMRHPKYAEAMTPAEFRQWRTRLGLSQAQAAAALNVTVRTVKRYEQAPETALDDPPFPVPRAVQFACRYLESLKACGSPPSRPANSRGHTSVR